MKIVTKDRERLVRMQKDLISKVHRLTQSGDREYGDKKCQEVVRDYKELNKGSYDNWEKESKHIGSDSFEISNKP